MLAKHPRIGVVLEKPLYDRVRRLAASAEISLSLKIRDLVNEALEAQEDFTLAELAAEREKTFRRTRALSHKQKTLKTIPGDFIPWTLFCVPALLAYKFDFKVFPRPQP